MTRKIANAWAAGCARSVVYQLAATLLVLGFLTACLLAAAVVPLPESVDRDLLMPLALGATVFTAIGLVLAWAAWVLVNRARRLDAAFAPTGMAGRSYLLNGRQYHGTWQGRDVDAYFYRGAVLDLYLSAPLGTRLVVGERSGLGRVVNTLLNRQPVRVDDPAFDRLAVYTQDEAWARALLSEPAVREAVLRLTADAGPFELRQVHMQPDALLLRLYRTDVARITPENVPRWLNDLRALARSAEALPAPAERLEASALERRTRSQRDWLFLPAMAVVFVLLIVPLVCFAIATIVAAISGAGR